MGGVLLGIGQQFRDFGRPQIEALPKFFPLGGCDSPRLDPTLDLVDGLKRRLLAGLLGNAVRDRESGR